MEHEAIGQRIRSARTRAGYQTGSRFADALELRPEQVSRFELGRRRPGIVVLQRMAELCGVSIDWLVYGDDAPPRGATQPPGPEAA